MTPPVSGVTWTITRSQDNAAAVTCGKRATRSWRLEGPTPAVGSVLAAPPTIYVRVGDTVEFIWSVNYLAASTAIIAPHNVFELVAIDGGE